MKKLKLLAASCALFIYGLSHAQVGAVTNNPDKNAALDLSGFNNKGLNLPKVALSSKSSPSPLTAHIAGMMVYNTATASSGSDAVTPGVYTNDGTQWVAGGMPSTSSTVMPGSWLLPSSATWRSGMTWAQVGTLSRYLPAGLYRWIGNDGYNVGVGVGSMPPGGVCSKLSIYTPGYAINPHGWMLDLPVGGTVNFTINPSYILPPAWALFQCIILY